MILFDLMGAAVDKRSIHTLSWRTKKRMDLASNDLDKAHCVCTVQGGGGDLLASFRV